MVTPAYQPREPSETVLYQVIAEHLETFVATLAADPTAKRKGQGNVKNGNPYLSWAYAEAATFAMRLHPRVQRYSQRKQAKTKVPVARKTVAHKLARACYHMMRHQVPFEGAKAFGSAIVAVGLRPEA